MKVKVLIDCVGIGYDLKTGDTAELNKELASKLIKFGYAEEVKTRKSSKETRAE
jgi:hypothetical protein